MGRSDQLGACTLGNPYTTSASFFDKCVAFLLAQAMLLQRLHRFFFSPKPAPHAVPVFSLPKGTRVYAVGDIHGRSHLLTKMLAAIEQHAAANPIPHVAEIFLGDYIDRGLYSREVVDMLLTPSAMGHERICLMGNHEEALLHFLRDPKILRDWANFGGYATLASYDIQIPGSMSPQTLIALRDRFQRNLPATHEAFFRGLKMTHVIGNYLFVHAGILPGIPLAAQKSEHLLWIREPFLQHEGFFEHYIVHGHSPVTTPDIHSHRANLDISAAEVDSLCCLIIEEGQRNILIV